MIKERLIINFVSDIKFLIDTETERLGKSKTNTKNVAGREIRSFERDCREQLKRLHPVKKQRRREGVKTTKIQDWEDSMCLADCLLLD
jgi:hypothetical protein